jgi:RecB family exonuclease
MSNISSDRIDDVAPGDIIAVDRGTGDPQPSKVVFKDSDEDAAVYTVTFEGDGGETFQKEIPAGTVVTHAMESKWESGESPTQLNPDTPA